MVRRINITIEDDLLIRLDSYAKKRHGSRSGLISFIVSMYLDSIDESVYSLKPTKPVE